MYNSKQEFNNRNIEANFNAGTHVVLELQIG